VCASDTPASSRPAGARDPRPGARLSVPGGSLAWSRGTDRRTVGSMARPTFKRAVVATLAAAAVLVSPTTAGAASYDPPSWFKNGAEKVKARPGAKCPGPKPFTRTRTIPGDLYDVTIRVEGTTEDCFHRLPKALAKSFQVLRPPLSDHPYREGCYGEYRHQTYPDDPGAGWTDSTWFRCDIFSRPVMEGRPNPRTWQCWRSKFSVTSTGPMNQMSSTAGASPSGSRRRRSTGRTSVSRASAAASTRSTASRSRPESSVAPARGSRPGSYLAARDYQVGPPRV
jgi:hypothetical protein